MRGQGEFMRGQGEFMRGQGECAGFRRTLRHTCISRSWCLGSSTEKRILFETRPREAGPPSCPARGLVP
eukprot:9360099-Pyramimonas_sp.AAC.1